MPTAEFFGEYGQLFLSLHLLGVVMGLGGATIADTFFFRFLKDLRISRREADVLQWISKIVLAALTVIFLSGIALYLADPLRYLQSPAFVFKMLIVAVLTVNGLLLHVFVSPRLMHISFVQQWMHDPGGSLRHMRRVAFGMGAVSVTSWYTVFFTATLKTLLPQDVTLPMLIGAYAAVLVTAVSCSQIMEHSLHRRGIS